MSSRRRPPGITGRNLVRLQPEFTDVGRHEAVIRQFRLFRPGYAGGAFFLDQHDFGFFPAENPRSGCHRSEEGHDNGDQDSHGGASNTSSDVISWSLPFSTVSQRPFGNRPASSS